MYLKVITECIYLLRKVLDSCLCIQWCQWPFSHAYVHLQGDTYMPLKTFVHILLFMPQLDYRWSTKFIIAHISCNSSKGHLLWTSSTNWVREFNICCITQQHIHRTEESLTALWRGSRGLNLHWFKWGRNSFWTHMLCQLSYSAGYYWGV